MKIDRDTPLAPHGKSIKELAEDICSAVAPFDKKNAVGAAWVVQALCGTYLAGYQVGVLDESRRHSRGNDNA